MGLGAAYDDAVLTLLFDVDVQVLISLLGLPAEVGAEETLYQEAEPVVAASEPNGDSGISVDAEAVETVDDEALPFEVRVGAGRSETESAKGHHGAKEAAVEPESGLQGNRENDRQ